jgi:uncharacterized protein YycO
MLIDLVGRLSLAVSKISPAPKKIKANDYRDLLAKDFGAGTVLLTRTTGSLSNAFIPDYWSHAAICTANGTVIEAAARGGVVETDIIDFMLHKDFIVACTPKFANLSEREKAVEFARLQLGKPYDFKFQYSDVKSFYCSELIYWSYSQVIPNIPFTLREVLGVTTVVPSDIVKAKKHWDTVWSSSSVK